ncbi:ABC transporter permease, partial [Streptococcus suis]
IVSMLASLLFGISQSLAVVFGQLPGFKDIPTVYLQIAQYFITVIALSDLFGKAVAPKAVGINYIKSI